MVRDRVKSESNYRRVRDETESLKNRSRETGLEYYNSRFDQALDVWRCHTFQGFESQHQCFIFCFTSTQTQTVTLTEFQSYSPFTLGRIKITIVSVHINYVCNIVVYVWYMLLFRYHTLV